MLAEVDLVVRTQGLQQFGIAGVYLGVAARNVPQAPSGQLAGIVQLPGKEKHDQRNYKLKPPAQI